MLKLCKMSKVPLLKDEHCGATNEIHGIVNKNVNTNSLKEEADGYEIPNKQMTSDLQYESTCIHSQLSEEQKYMVSD